MKTTLIALITLLSSTAAMAAPNYRCESMNRNENLAPLMVNLDGRGKIELGAIVENSPFTPQTLSEQNIGNIPSGFVRFTGTSGCSQLGGFARCYAMVLEVAFVSKAMLQGSMNGEVIYNGQKYSCDLLMMMDDSETANQ